MHRTDKEIDRALTLVHMASAFGYAGNVVPSNGKPVTGKWYAKKRKEILAHARVVARDSYLAYLAARKASPEERIRMYSEDAAPVSDESGDSGP